MKTYSWCAAVEVIEILIEGIAIELDGNNLLCCRVRDPEGFLEAFQYALAVLQRILVVL